ncbi:uncharacterized protein [Eucyclogobius newberryi]|uniref:uncharacterized protein n=1 Tax=Eucyclogobius newberryi TaxID=166745 RepID=UPI003B5CB775
MSAGQTLRALVNARLTAAAEDIFVLFERTIAEYEKELSRSKQENQRKQELLDSVLSPRFVLTRAGVQIPSLSPGPGLNQEIPETPLTKEEPEDQSVKEEEEQLQVVVPESSVVFVKTEESSLFQQRQTEHRENSQDEDISSHFHSETEGDTHLSSYIDNGGDWRAPFSCSAPRMDTEANGDHYNHIQIRARSTASQNLVLYPEYKSAHEMSYALNYDMSRTTEGAEEKKHQCPVCMKRFGCKRDLQRHIRVHTGEKPFSCSICKKAFSRESIVAEHMKTHTGDRPYSCSICKKTFAQMCNLKVHTRTHTGETPFSCSVCMKPFAQRSNLLQHMKTHTQETHLAAVHFV